MVERLSQLQWAQLHLIRVRVRVRVRARARDRFKVRAQLHRRGHGHARVAEEGEQLHLGYEVRGLGVDFRVTG